MRRKDHEMDKDFALMVVDKCEYAVLGMADKQQPYCIPITIARDGDFIYFHSAKQGRKTDLLRENPSVCLTCVGDTHIMEGMFTTEFESAVVFGKAEAVMEDQEKIHGLRLICERHAPDNMSEFDEAIERSLFRTAVWKISIGEITGKRKKYDKNGEEMKFGRME